MYGQAKVNVECSDPMSYKHTNKRRIYGDIPKEFQKTKYKPLKVKPPPKIKETDVFNFTQKK